MNVGSTGPEGTEPVDEMRHQVIKTESVNLESQRQSKGATREYRIAISVSRFLLMQPKGKGRPEGTHA